MAKSKNAAGSGSIRQRKDGTWEARISLGANPGTGKPVRRSIYGKTQREVRQKMTAILHDVDNGTYQKPSKLTVKMWLDEWMNTFCMNKLKPLTISSYQGNIKNHILPYIGAMELQAVRGYHIQSIYNTLVEKGLSGKTITGIGAIMHKAFAVAVKQGLMMMNPCDSTELPKVERHEIKPLSDSDIGLFLKAIQGEPMENAFALCLFAGLREGECLGLSWSQVDFEKKRITINQQLQKSKSDNQYSIVPFTKSDKPRTIEPPAIAFEYLRNEQKKQAEFKEKAFDVWNNPDNLVFTNELGRHYAIFTFYKNFKRIAASIGRPDARPHDLRHTAATVAIASGADIKSVQDLLGHATASFTLDRYAHTSERMMKDTAQRMQDYYSTLETTKKS